MQNVYVLTLLGSVLTVLNLVVDVVIAAQPTAANSGAAIVSTQAAGAAMIQDANQCRATQKVIGIANNQGMHCAQGARILFEGVSIVARVTGNCEAICIKGTGNEIIVEGNALAIAVRGKSNQVRAMRVDAVSLRGLNNSVWYRDILGGQGPLKSQPQVMSKGMDNSITLQ